MPTNVAKYAQEPLVVKLTQLHKLNLEIKDHMHSKVTYHQSKVEGKMAIISRGKKYTELKPVAVKLLRACEKKDGGEKVERKIRLSRVQPKMSRFLRLKERGLPTDKYPDTLVMSMFSDFVVREGRSDGLNVKLFGKDDWFVQLFREELSQPGSGPDTVDADGNTVPTSVLDKDGNIINPFPRCKHMVIFKNLYVQKRQLTGDKYVMKRETISGEEYSQCIHLYEKERDLLKRTLKDARTKYKDSLDRYNNLLAKQEEAKAVGDSSARTAILTAKRDLDANAKSYVAVLNANSLTHKIKV